MTVFSNFKNNKHEVEEERSRPGFFTKKAVHRRGVGRNLKTATETQAGLKTFFDKYEPHTQPFISGSFRTPSLLK